MKPMLVQEVTLHFNSQPHKEADGKQCISVTFSIISTHSLTRRLTDNTEQKGKLIWISTHSLTRRLTEEMGKIKLSNIISTHSLTRRLTCHLVKSSPVSDYFNSQPHKEADFLPNHLHDHLQLFQLTASQGGWRVMERCATEIMRLFQLTASQGGWHLTPYFGKVRQSISTHSLTRRLTRLRWI